MRPVDFQEVVSVQPKSVPMVRVNEAHFGPLRLRSLGTRIS